MTFAGVLLQWKIIPHYGKRDISRCGAHQASGKIASQVAKSDGLVVVDADTELEVLHRLPECTKKSGSGHAYV